MIIRKPTPRKLGLNEPIRQESHKRPVTRRDFIAQGFMTGAATVATGGIFSLFANPRAAMAALSPDIEAFKAGCGIEDFVGKVPFICFDLAGGANMVGSNVLIGQQGGQVDFITTAGYAKQGLPGDMTPPSPNAARASNDFIESTLGLRFHSDSAFVRGILERVTPTTAANINGAVIAARSENDTGNNPHNPMYGIARAGANGSLLTLIGSRASDSGGNSMAPLMMVNPELRPTKVDRASDVTGLVDTGDLVGLLSAQDTVAVMESIARISRSKLGQVNPKLGSVSADDVVRDLVHCGYIKSADLVDRFGGVPLNPDEDPVIVDPTTTRATGIFGRAEYDNDAEFRKTAAVMKMVLSGYAGAGTITMGGYDYHGQGRATGEVRDLRAGRCMGACLEYAARAGVPLMLYVFSDGSLSANGQVDTTADGRNKFMWASDNQQTAASFFLVYNPGGRPQLLTTGAGAERHQQIGYFRGSGDVETASSPAANNVNLLVETVILNYMALHGEQGQFSTLFPTHGLGNAALQDSLIAFNPVV